MHIGDVQPGPYADTYVFPYGPVNTGSPTTISPSATTDWGGWITTGLDFAEGVIGSIFGSKTSTQPQVIIQQPSGSGASAAPQAASPINTTIIFVGFLGLLAVVLATRK